MSLLSDGMLSGLRDIASSAMPDTATIQRLTQVVDDMGDSTDTYATASTVACRVSRSGQQADERIIAERITGHTAFTLFLPHDADVRESDRITVGSQLYEVAGVLAPTSWMVHVRVVCSRQG